MPRRGARPMPPRRVDYWTLAQLRYHIRRFLRAREIAARAAGIEPQHYLVLLQLKGLTGKRAATMGTLAERLQLRHHSTVELVDRLVSRGMVRRRRDTRDRRETGSRCVGRSRRFCQFCRLPAVLMMKRRMSLVLP